jgi:curved DNA-binding protein CbpA
MRIKSMARSDEIEEARQLLGLGETATLSEIKSAYRCLAQRHHPDKHGGTESDENEIIDYCTDYRYSFRQEDVARVYPKEEDYRSWYDKWSGSV